MEKKFVFTLVIPPQRIEGDVVKAIIDGDSAWDAESEAEAILIQLRDLARNNGGHIEVKAVFTS